jgi:hypothetical protein
MRGELDRAAALADEGVALTRATGYRLGIGWGERLLALIARRRTDHARARALLEQALATFSGASANFEAARTRLLLAEACGDLGDHPAAGRALADARDAFLAQELTRYVGWSETLAVALGVRGPSDPAGATRERLPRWA